MSSIESIGFTGGESFVNCAALLCVDLQHGFTRGNASLFELDRLLETVSELQTAARKSLVPVVHVRFNGDVGHPAFVGSEGWEFESIVQPLKGDVIVEKNSCDSFFKSDLDAELRRRYITELYVVGCITELCVDSTVRTAAGLGYNVRVVSDGHSTPDASIEGCPLPQQRIKWFNHVMSRIGDAQFKVTVENSTDIRTRWRANS
jgi:nicotinamidase-related amidase